jgi:DNA excision repair protein ERCC-2
MELREDQRDVVKRLVNALSSAPWVALQAPTGWGKTVAVLAAIEELGLKPALWLTPRLSISLHVYNHAVNYFGLKTLATAGREKLCTYGYGALDFMRGICRNCALNRPVSFGDLKQLSGSLDFGRIKELGETLQVCPYSLQAVLERDRRYELIIAHYGRANRLIRAKPKIIIVDESHNLIIPRVHQIETRVLSMILEKIGFSEHEISNLIQSPEALKAVLAEVLDTMILIAEDDDVLKPAVEELVSMLQAQIWYYAPDENTINALEVAELPRNNAQTLFMSATLPPQMLNNPNTIIIHRGWNIPVHIDAKFVLSYENIMRRGNEIRKYVAEKYLKPSTVVFTTTTREDLLPIDRGGIVWEDEIKAPCDYKESTVILKVFGKYNEGINADCFENVVVLGYPLHPPNVMSRLASRGINEEEFVTMVITQILGRSIRSATPPPQMPKIYLVDKRFRRIKSKLLNYEIEVVDA